MKKNNILSAKSARRLSFSIKRYNDDELKKITVEQFIKENEDIKILASLLKFHLDVLTSKYPFKDYLDLSLYDTIELKNILSEYDHILNILGGEVGITNIEYYLHCWSQINNQWDIPIVSSLFMMRRQTLQNKIENRTKISKASDSKKLPDSIPPWINDFSKVIQWKSGNSNKILFNIINYYQNEKRFEITNNKIKVCKDNPGIWILSLFEVLESDGYIVNITGKKGDLDGHIQRIITVFNDFKKGSLKTMRSKINNKDDQGRFKSKYIKTIRNELEKIAVIN